MCYTDWAAELGNAAGGVEVYKSVEDLCKHRPCVASCGIVKVKVELESHLAERTSWTEPIGTIEEVEEMAKKVDKSS